MGQLPKNSASQSATPASKNCVPRRPAGAMTPRLAAASPMGAAPILTLVGTPDGGDLHAAAGGEGQGAGKYGRHGEEGRCGSSADGRTVQGLRKTKPMVLRQVYLSFYLNHSCKENKFEGKKQNKTYF